MMACADFEKKFALWQGRKHCVMFNSGSSANLALIQALLNIKKLKKRGLWEDYVKGTPTHKDKDKEKDKDLVKDKEQDKDSLDTPFTPEYDVENDIFDKEILDLKINK